MSVDEIFETPQEDEIMKLESDDENEDSDVEFVNKAGKQDSEVMNLIT